MNSLSLTMLIIITKCNTTYITNVSVPLSTFFLFHDLSLHSQQTNFAGHLLLGYNFLVTYKAKANLKRQNIPQDLQ